MKKTLDEEYPQGDPHATICRHCGRGKVRKNWALMCSNCDNRNGEPITQGLLSS